MAKEDYPPEVIVLLSSKLKNDASVSDRLRLFCTRIIEVEHISIINGSSDNSDEGERNSSHVKSWDENCGWTKIRLFELDEYDTILYIDADCLVVKDVCHLLRIGEDDHEDRNNLNRRKGLVAAAPDIFPPDKFNAGVMVLRPSREVFDDMMSRLPTQGAENDNTKCSSYDGGDTGYLNSYYPSWYSSWPEYSRLSFGYNAQRLMYHYTYQNRPQYWDEGIDSLYIVHFSSSPKPWDAMRSSSKDEESTDFLNGEDETNIQRLKGGKLEQMWQAAYERSQKYFMKTKRKQLASTKPSKQPAQPKQQTKVAMSEPIQDDPKRFNKRFKELRASGISLQEAMKKARTECGLDKLDNVDPTIAVGQMFGLR